MAYPQMLILEPPEVLTFNAPFNSHTQCSLEVSNPTPYPISYKLKTTASYRYNVKPKMGRILPYSSELVLIRLKAAVGTEEDKFKLLSFVVTDTTESLEKSWENYDETKAMVSKLNTRFIGRDNRHLTYCNSVATETSKTNEFADKIRNIFVIVAICAIAVTGFYSNFVIE